MQWTKSFQFHSHDRSMPPVINLLNNVKLLIKIKNKSKKKNHCRVININNTDRKKESSFPIATQFNWKTTRGYFVLLSAYFECIHSGGIYRQNELCVTKQQTCSERKHSIKYIFTSMWCACTMAWARSINKMYASGVCWIL